MSSSGHISAIRRRAGRQSYQYPSELPNTRQLKGGSKPRELKTSLHSLYFDTLSDKLRGSQENCSNNDIVRFVCRLTRTLRATLDIDIKALRVAACRAVEHNSFVDRNCGRRVVLACATEPHASFRGDERRIRHKLWPCLLPLLLVVNNPVLNPSAQVS